MLSRKAEGSGIGLSLVKSLVEAHRGKIWVESQWGCGSEFFIELPVKLVQDTDAKVFDESTVSFKSNIEKISIEFSDIYNNI
ncbi:hypothetical protein BJL90_00270 [Clostridium formicaceticum]|uniref:histidine kinase n=1 Tax=Clostridium formicaceticum TaxID=1497 RepID=A0ABM6ENN7_9CLOT|nr:hypothetical protein BJL90_00270 [Clostridium formicaceticum]